MAVVERKLHDRKELTLIYQELPQLPMDYIRSDMLLPKYGICCLMT